MAGPKRVNFSKRRNGKEMCTVGLDLHLDRELVEFYQRSLKLSRADAVKHIVSELQYQLSDYMSTRTPVATQTHKGDPTLRLEHYDSLRDERLYAEERGERWEELPQAMDNYYLFSFSH